MFHFTDDILHLIFPNNCVICERNLQKNEYCICLTCSFLLPYTNFHLIQKNPIEKKLWGRVKVEQASSLLFFEKPSSVQKLLYLLKYKGREDIGDKLATLYAQTLLKDKTAFLDIDCIIPVPLHIKKMKRRGYNQCAVFAEKLGELLQKEVLSKTVVRKIDTNSQTKKNRIDRWESVSKIFKVKKPQLLKGKHILLVDDVITTGATIEALASKILEIENTKVSVAFMASTI